VAKPKRPQTLGKIERFWGTLWRECIESAVFIDLDDARQRIGLFVDHYNFQRDACDLICHLRPDLHVLIRQVGSLLRRVNRLPPCHDSLSKIC
jgi:hypothetical protein